LLGVCISPLPTFRLSLAFFSWIKTTPPHFFFLVIFFVFSFFSTGLARLFCPRPSGGAFCFLLPPPLSTARSFFPDLDTFCRRSLSPPPRFPRIPAGPLEAFTPPRTVTFLLFRVTNHTPKPAQAPFFLRLCDILPMLPSPPFFTLSLFFPKLKHHQCRLLEAGYGQCKTSPAVVPLFASNPCTSPFFLPPWHVPGEGRAFSFQRPPLFSNAHLWLPL